MDDIGEITHCEQLSHVFATHLIHKLSNQNMNDDKITVTELDSHADYPVVGKHAKILESSSRTAMVSGFTTELGKPLRVPIVTAAIAYEDEYTGKVYTLVIHNALYLKNVEVNLIPPIMMKIAGLKVDECPKFLVKHPSENNHSIYFPISELRIPLQIEGIIS